MSDESMKAMLGWETLSSSEQQRLRRASIELDQHVRDAGHRLKDQQDPQPFVIAAGDEWTPTMKAVLSAWLKTERWASRFKDGGEKSLEVQLRRIDPTES